MAHVCHLLRPSSCRGAARRQYDRSEGGGERDGGHEADRADQRAHDLDRHELAHRDLLKAAPGLCEQQQEGGRALTPGRACSRSTRGRADRDGGR